MDNKIHFQIPKTNELLVVTIHLSRPDLEKKLDRVALSMPHEFQNVRFGMIEKDKNVEEVSKFLRSCNAKIKSEMKILGLIICEVESQYLEKIAEHKNIKFLSI